MPSRLAQGYRLSVPGSWWLGRDNGTRSGPGTLLHGWQTSGILVPHQESPDYDGVCPPSKTPWAVQQEGVGWSLFEGLSGHLWEVTEITLGIRTVPICVSHIHMDGNGHGRHQPMLLVKEEPTADSRAGLWCGCLYFRCGFKWSRIKLR